MMKTIESKVLPEAVDLEEIIIGAILLESYSYIKVKRILAPIHFYDSKHANVYLAVNNLHDRREPIDILTVTNELRRIGKLEDIGGAYFITGLTNRVASSSNIEFHARIVLQKYLQRMLISIAYTISEDAYSNEVDPIKLITDIRISLDKLVKGNLSSHQVYTIAQKSLMIADKLELGISPITSIHTGITDLNEKIHGWKSGDLYVVAARPGMGKTGFILSEARALALKNHKSLIFSLEMTAEQLAARYISISTGITLTRIIDGKSLDIEEKKLVREVATRDIGKLIFIDDSPATTAEYIHQTTARMISEYGIEMVFDDYIQLHKAGKKVGSREEEISAITATQKQTAKENSIPYLALSQLNRATEKRGGSHRPQLLDLRESGAIEQDADAVMFIYRPEYYDILVDDANNSTEGVAEIIIAKHRNGPLGKVILKFIKHQTEFLNASLPVMRNNTKDEF